jgi:nitroimidazol reductase NimA-like FMN-containing flavoprotein (pyridoxamine 5'-phosphate oxidase superfamily)
MAEIEPIQRTRIRQVPQRGIYDRETIHRILDEGLVCHVAFVHENQPFGLPMNDGRDGESLVLHGAPESRLMRVAASGATLCVSVTHVDGLVVARSAAHLTMNYRSVVIIGSAVAVTERPAKRAALRALIEHFLPGRWEESLPPTDAELDAVAVVRMPLLEASAKVRVGPPRNDASDDRPRWSGEVPLRLVALRPVAGADGPVSAAVPPSVEACRRPGWRWAEGV